MAATSVWCQFCSLDCKPGLQLANCLLVVSAEQLQDLLSFVASSDYFIQPTVQSRVAAACFLVAEDPVDPQTYATRAATVEHSSVKDVGMGIFFTSRRAVTADHNFPVDWPIGTLVAISFPGM
jgi:hypothetical protein